MPKTARSTTRSLYLAPDLANLASGRRFIAEGARQAGFPEERLFDIIVASCEAISNAVEHAGSAENVIVTTFLYPDRFEVQVEGPGEFQAPDRLDGRPTRGLGLPLMAKLADHLALYSGPRGGTMVSLSFYRPGAGRREQPDQRAATQAMPPSVRELIEENELISAITSNAPVAIFVLDSELRYRWTNPTYQHSLPEPFRSRDLTAVRIQQTRPDLRAADGLEHMYQASRTGQPIFGREYEVRMPSDLNYWWRESVVPLREASAEPPYDLLVMITDETKFKRSQAERDDLLRAIVEQRSRLQATVERLNRSQEIAHLGSWELDLEHDELSWSDEVYRILGLEPQESPARYGDFLERVHPDDRLAVDSAYSASLSDGRDSYEIEHRIVRPDGEVRWVQEKCTHTRGGNGRVVRSTGMVLDITEQREACDKQQKSEQRLSQIIQHVPLGLCQMDFDGPRFTSVNDVMCKQLGYSPKELMALNPLELIDNEGRQRIARRVEALASGSDVSPVLQFPVRTKSGQYRDVLLGVSPIVVDGVAQGASMVALDVTERTRIEEELSKTKQALRAALTKSGGD